MITFEPITLSKKEEYEHYLRSAKRRGCEFSLANLFLWGEQKTAICHDHLVFFTHYNGRDFYPFPSGTADKKPVLEALLKDAKERNVPFVLTGLHPEDKETIEKLYPGQFIFRYDRDSFDYVYLLEDLATLAGRKFQKKRNHYRRFQKNNPDYRVTPITPSDLHIVEQFLLTWYEQRYLDAPESDFTSEKIALEKALSNWELLEMEGVILYVGNAPVALTIASRMNETTFDVHFEKALATVDGAYAAINCEFAQYLHNKYPEALYADREEDLGIPGLRKAKESYQPHHLVEKYRAYLKEDTFAIGTPALEDKEELIVLWQEGFGDDPAFCENFFSTAFATDHSFCIKVNERIVSVLYWMDCEYKNQKFAYLYAITTAVKYRGQNLCRTLMEYAHKQLLNSGYDGVLLVPGEESLISYYSSLGYKVSTYVTEKIFEKTDSFENAYEVVDCNTYANKRKDFLPDNSVIQEGAQLDFLSTYATLYANEDFVAAIFLEDDHVFAFEYLGDESKIPSLLDHLNRLQGTFRVPGKEKPFAMLYPLKENIAVPDYFGLAYD